MKDREPNWTAVLRLLPLIAVAGGAWKGYTAWRDHGWNPLLTGLVWFVVVLAGQLLLVGLDYLLWRMRTKEDRHDS
jgi:hypothetical protein